jgi:hypothetical protein
MGGYEAVRVGVETACTRNERCSCVEACEIERPLRNHRFVDQMRCADESRVGVAVLCAAAVQSCLRAMIDSSFCIRAKSHIACVSAAL